MTHTRSLQEQADDLVVGENTNTILLTSLDAFQFAIDHLSAQARRSVKLFSQELDHDFYDRDAFVERISQVCRRNRDSHVQILLKDANKAVKQGHRLVELKKRLPSHIDMRLLSAEFADMNDEYLLVDDIALVKRFAQGTLRGHCECRAIPDAAKYARQFNHIWEHCLPCRDLERIHL